VSVVAAPRGASDTAWFSDAVVAILPELYGTARRLTKNAADAEI
jgi:DNA-directed RNA polymerase specialized sigma24 family protein